MEFGKGRDIDWLLRLFDVCGLEKCARNVYVKYLEMIHLNTASLYSILQFCANLTKILHL